MRDTKRYRVAGVRVPSVTEVLELCGMSTFDQVPENRLERARQRGKDVHSWCEAIDRGWIDEEEPDLRIASQVDAYRRFKQETGFKPVEIEVPRVCETWLYAGTVDRIGILNGSVGVVDLKPAAKYAVT